MRCLSAWRTWRRFLTCWAASWIGSEGCLAGATADTTCADSAEVGGTPIIEFLATDISLLAFLYPSPACPSRIDLSNLPQRLGRDAFGRRGICQTHGDGSSIQSTADCKSEYLSVSSAYASSSFPRFLDRSVAGIAESLFDLNIEDQFARHSGTLSSSSKPDLRCSRLSPLTLVTRRARR